MTSAIKQLVEQAKQIDFTEANQKLADARSALSEAEKQDAAVRDEIIRLAEEIHAFEGPDPEAVAEAVLSGTCPSEAATASVSLRELLERREALTTSRRTIATRLDDLRTEVRTAEAEGRNLVLDAAWPLIEEVGERQKKAAQTLLDCFVELQVIGSVTGRYIPGAPEAEKAVKGVTASGSLLRVPSAVQVPSELLAAFEVIAQQCDAVRGVPSIIHTP